MTPDQQVFEAAAYVYYQERHAAGKTSDSHEQIGTPENFFWKEADGTYGVVMINAAWWGWQAAARSVSSACHERIVGLNNELRNYKEREKTMGWSQE